MAQVGEESGFGLGSGFASDLTQNFISQLGNSFSGGGGGSNSHWDICQSFGRAGVLVFSSCRALLGWTAEGGCPHVIHQIALVLDHYRFSSLRPRAQLPICVR